ncbi:MAG: hypothetical protein ACQEQK_03350 [Thermodesulfobacteriota bacterium]
MTYQQFENLVNTRQIKKESGDQREFDGLVKSGRIRLQDAKNTELSLESRFDLAYNAAHALSLAALRWHGYRSENRYIVFQCLQHTLNTEPATWRVLAHCHNLRNRGEYEGLLDVSERLVADLIIAADEVYVSVAQLPPVD